MSKVKKYMFENFGFFIFFGLFHLHRRWGLFIVLGAFVFCLGVKLLKHRRAQFEFSLEVF